MSQNNQNLKNTPLYEAHIRHGAKMVAFSGWNMPLQYTGIIEEHIHTRQKAGLFDIFHMGEFFLRGRNAENEVEKLVTCRISDMREGKARYGFLLNESGGIIDDLIVFRLKAEEFMLVVNSGCVEKDASWIKEHISSRVNFSDESQKIAKLDLQGPFSGEVLSVFGLKDTIDNIKRYHFVNTEINGIKVLLSRTGYTGELGYELFFAAEHMIELWDAFLKIDAVKPVGLGARDTLRMEMGYSLYGNDIDETRTPIEANLQKFVCMEKDFIGKAALLKQKTRGIKSRLTGFICEGRRSARSHFKVMVKEEEAGEVTSGAFSPCLKKGIGLCYITEQFIGSSMEISLCGANAGIRAVLKNIPIYQGL